VRIKISGCTYKLRVPTGPEVRVWIFQAMKSPEIAHWCRNSPAFMPRDAVQARSIFVRPSVTFVNSVKTSSHIIKLFSTIG